MVWIFVPFYQDEIKRLELVSIYQDIFVFDGDSYLTKYIEYIKQLLSKHHDNNIIDKQEFIKLLSVIAENYHLIEKLSNEKTIEFEDTIKKELSLS